MSDTILDNLGLLIPMPSVTKRQIARAALSRIVRGKLCRPWSRGRDDALMHAHMLAVIYAAQKRIEDGQTKEEAQHT